MTETEQPPAATATETPAPRRAGRILIALVLIAVAGAAAYGGWLTYRYAADTIEAVSTQQTLLVRLEREVRGLRGEVEDISGRQSDLSQAARRNSMDIATLSQRLEGSEELVARISETVEGGRARVQLAAIEQLLLLANDRLLLARDVSAARTALDLADQRLAAQGDPRLHRVREALAAERAALAAVAQPDVAGAALALAELAKRAPKFPLRARVPETFEAAPDVIDLPKDAPWPKRVWAAVRTAIGSVFALRRDDGSSPRLLPPEEEALVAQILRLRLDGARLALLARDGAAFGELAGACRDWLKDYYNTADPGVKAALAELDRLTTLELAPDLPDISRSLALLRAQMQPAAQ
jgi:uroporphyrin-III C-methyltransferase